jgi:hypothetical protein
MLSFQVNLSELLINDYTMSPEEFIKEDNSLIVGAVSLWEDLSLLSLLCFS